VRQSSTTATKAKDASRPLLLILNHAPYDGPDLTWNALRLPGQLNKDGVELPTNNVPISAGCVRLDVFFRRFSV